MTLLYRAGVDPLKALKIVGHNEYQTTADIFTHLDQEMMQATADDLADVFKKVNTAARKKQMQSSASKVLSLFLLIGVSGKRKTFLVNIHSDVNCGILHVMTSFCMR